MGVSEGFSYFLAKFGIHLLEFGCFFLFVSSFHPPFFILDLPHQSPGTVSYADFSPPSIPKLLLSPREVPSAPPPDSPLFFMPPPGFQGPFLALTQFYGSQSAITGVFPDFNYFPTHSLF